MAATTQWRAATPGEGGACRLCERSITWNGSYWLDSDGARRCKAGHVHSVTGVSSMPMRASVPHEDDGSEVGS